jgi:Helix-turn-helix domain
VLALGARSLYLVRMPKVEPLHSDDEWLTTAVVAALVGVDVATVNRWAKSGRLRVAVKLPGVRGPNLYRRADVDALLAEAGAA